MNLIDIAFKRVCDFAETHGFKVEQSLNGNILFHMFNENGSKWNTWSYKNKSEFLIGDKFVMSLFSCIVYNYEYSYYSYLIHNSRLKHKNILSFIESCKILKDCICIEELTIKMDLMGI